MIITCPSCKKKFNIDINLIPSEGRDLQCGSCEHIWFYEKQEPISEPLQINEDIVIKEKEDSENLNKDRPKDELIKKPVEENKKKESELLNIKKTNSEPEVIKKNQGSNFFFIFNCINNFIRCTNYFARHSKNTINKHISWIRSVTIQPI